MKKQLRKSDIDTVAIKRRTAEFVAYKQIINFDSMQELFGDDYDVIDGIYAHLRNYYGGDYLFWLQYGRAEVHFDNFSTAENYLNQSLGIRHNYQAEHYLGVLFMKRALYRDSTSEAAADVKRGEEILRQQIHDRGDTDAYPYSALLTHKLRYLRKYRTVRFKEELEELKELGEIGLRQHGAIRDTYNEVLREYLMQAIPTQNVQAEAVSETAESLNE